jgi:hypothetical protein
MGLAPWAGLRRPSGLITSELDQYSHGGEQREHDFFQSAADHQVFIYLFLMRSMNPAFTHHTWLSPPL